MVDKLKTLTVMRVTVGLTQFGNDQSRLGIQIFADPSLIGYDETIYPVDFRYNGHIVDDEMHRIMLGCCRPFVF